MDVVRLKMSGSSMGFPTDARTSLCLARKGQGWNKMELLCLLAATADVPGTESCSDSR